MSYLQEAFNQTCHEARLPEGHYVVLFEHTSRYGGPEEGGWYINDRIVSAYQWCETREKAEAILAAVQALAKELERESKVSHGKQCLREMAWLEARGLDADWLPEPDGPSEFSVSLTDSIPENRYGPRHYE